MKTFKDYLRERQLEEKSKFIAIIYDGATQTKLQKFCQEHGFDITQNYDGDQIAPTLFEFHTTIFFTTTKHRLENSEKNIEPNTVNPVKYEMLGQDRDIPVLKVDGDDIHKIRDHFSEEHGMRDAWPDWKPHISLSYVRGDYPNIDSIPLPDFELVFDKIVIRNGDE